MIGQCDQEGHKDRTRALPRRSTSYPTPMRLVLFDAAVESGEEVDAGLVVVGLMQRFGDTSLEAHQLAPRTMERTASASLTVGLDRVGRYRQRLHDLFLGQIHVVTKDEAVALSRGEVIESLDDLVLTLGADHPFLWHFESFDRSSSLDDEGRGRDGCGRVPG